MSNILLATDADWLFDEVRAALEGRVRAGGGDDGADANQVSRISSGRNVGAAVKELTPSLVVLDMQIGSMGGFAACLELQHDIEAGRLDDVPVLLLLDREADVFLARESGADAWLVKPLNPLMLKRKAQELVGAASQTATPATRISP